MKEFSNSRPNLSRATNNVEPHNNRKKKHALSTMFKIMSSSIDIGNKKGTRDGKKGKKIIRTIEKSSTLKKIKF